MGKGKKIFGGLKKPKKKTSENVLGTELSGAHAELEKVSFNESYIKTS